MCESAGSHGWILSDQKLLTQEDPSYSPSSSQSVGLGDRDIVDSVVSLFGDLVVHGLVAEGILPRLFSLIILRIVDDLLGPAVLLAGGLGCVA